jgi:AraC-like DNA-binding protein
VTSDRQPLEHVEHHFEGPFEAWRKHVGIVFDAAQMASPDNTGQFSSKMYVTPLGAVERAAYDAVTIHHNERHAEIVGGLISIGRYPTGGPVAFRLRIPATELPRTLTLFDQSQPFDSIHAPSVIQNIYLFKSTLGLRESEKTAFRVLRPGTPAGALLNAEMDRLFEAHGADSPVFYEDMLLRFIACVRVALSPEPVGPDIRRRARDALRDLICDFLKQNLNLRELGAALILRKFGVSRATLYRMFQPFGGLRVYISNQRLLHAALDLSRLEPVRGSIVRTAERWGFSSAVHFNRSIRGTFGTSPGELFEVPLEELAVPTSFDYLNPFLRN